MYCKLTGNTKPIRGGRIRNSQPTFTFYLDWRHVGLRSRALSAILLAVVLSVPAGMSQLPGVPFSVQTAHAAAPVGRETITNGRDWLLAQSRATWTAGVSSVTLVRESSGPIAIATASALARSENGPLLTVTGDVTADSNILSELDRLKPGKALLVGPGWSFKEPERAEVGMRVPNTTWIASAGPEDLSRNVASFFASSPDTVFVAPSTGPELALASWGSALQKSPLIIPAGGTIDTGAISELKRLGVKRAFYFGTVRNDFATALDSNGIPVNNIGGTTIEQMSASLRRLLSDQNVAHQNLFLLQATGVNADSSIVASVAAAQSTLPLLATSTTTLTGSASETISGWGPEISSVRMIGSASDFPDTYVQQVSNALTAPRSASLTMSVVNVAKNSQGTSTITLSPHPGASLYRVYDLEGTTVYEGTGVSFVLPTSATTFKVSAVAADGTQIAERDLRVSEPDGNTDVSNRVYTSSASTSTTVSWPEASTPRPRRIQRAEMFRDVTGSLQLTEPKIVGYTCSGSFTDTTRPASQESVYAVVQFGTITNNECVDSKPSSSAREPLESLASIRVPSLSSATMQAATAESTGSTGGGKATPTMAEAALSAAMSSTSTPTGEDGALTTQASQSPLPWMFRYQTFIAPSLVRPVGWHGQTFNGNNRGFSAWSNEYKTRTDTTFTFDNAWHVTGASSSPTAVGQTIEYNCPDIWSWNGCYETRRATASSSGVSTRFWFEGYGTASAEVTHSVGLPIGIAAFGGATAPAIDYKVKYRYGLFGFNILGVHDGAPSHEIWGGYVPGEFIPLMLHNQNCDFPWGLAGFCSVNFNYKI